MFRASGPSGLLRVGYQVAAEIGPWDITLAPRLPRSFLFIGRLGRAHAYWMTQTPLDLMVALGSVEWLWRDVVVEHVGDGEISIELRDRPIVSERAVMVGLEE